MSVIIKSVDKGSPAYRAGLRGGETLLSLNGNSIMDVLDYRFYQNSCGIQLEYTDESGNIRSAAIKKDEYEELGLGFETYLMDKKHSCLNKCVFCFIDQLPKGLRDSLYFNYTVFEKLFLGVSLLIHQVLHRLQSPDRLVNSVL